MHRMVAAEKSEGKKSLPLEKLLKTYNKKGDFVSHTSVNVDVFLIKGLQYYIFEDVQLFKGNWCKSLAHAYG